MLTWRRGTSPELTNPWAAPAGTTTISPALASIVSPSTVNVARPSWRMNVSS
jgi:hypothetical protein